MLHYLSIYYLHFLCTWHRYTVYVNLDVCGKQLYDWAFMCMTNFMNELHMNGTEGSGTLLKRLTSSTINLIVFNHACFIFLTYAAVLKCS